MLNQLMRSVSSFDGPELLDAGMEIADSAPESTSDRDGDAKPPPKTAPQNRPSLQYLQLDARITLLQGCQPMAHGINAATASRTNRAAEALFKFAGGSPEPSNASAPSTEPQHFSGICKSVFQGHRESCSNKPGKHLPIRRPDPGLPNEADA